MAPTHQKKALHAILSSKLNNLTIPSSSSSPPTDFDFSDVFGPPTPSSTSYSLTQQGLPGSLPFAKEPEVIHNRSHSFVGPSPRFALSECRTFDSSQSEGDEDEDGEDEVDDLRIDDVDEGKEEVSRKIGPNDFEILRVVGQGAFGKVFQVISKRGNDGGIAGDGIFAMKVMRKEPIIKKNHVDYMRAERDILTKVVHPFIVQLSEDQARFYTAEIVSAVAHLHKSGIVHRDLKPENILMDTDGHVMLTDFGLAKEITESSRSNSLCGTTEYMAPEILQSKGHNKDADWWSIRILLYEMLTGQVPFTHKNRQKLQQRIIQEKVKLPPFLTGEAHSLLKGFLQKNPSKRLGSGANGSEEVKRHKWFPSINWKTLEAREVKPKFKPDVDGKECTANFDNCWTAMPPHDSPAATPTAGEHFQGNTYVAPNTWLSSI